MTQEGHSGARLRQDLVTFFEILHHLDMVSELHYADKASMDHMRAFRGADAVRSSRHMGAWLALGAAAIVALGAASCVKVYPATDLGTSPLATGPSGTERTLSDPMAYVQDIKPFFDSDCVFCHDHSRPSGEYSMTTYAEVMKDVRPGSASSRLVVLSQSNGSMYRYFTGDRKTKAAMVKKWVVTDGAAETR